MELKSKDIDIGDWIRAESELGSIIEGQSLSKTRLGMFSVIEVAITESDTIHINVNFWDIIILRKSLIKIPKLK